MTDQSMRDEFEAWASQRGLFRQSSEGTYCTNHYDDFAACWQAATRQALERAAKVCDSKAEHYNLVAAGSIESAQHNDACADTADECAAAIRALEG